MRASKREPGATKKASRKIREEKIERERVRENGGLDSERNKRAGIEKIDAAERQDR